MLLALLCFLLVKTFFIFMNGNSFFFFLILSHFLYGLSLVLLYASLATHLLDSPVLLGATGGQWGEAWHEEVETGEGHHVDSQLPQVSIQLAREPQTGGHTGHGGADQMVQVTVGGGGQLQGSNDGNKST